MTPEAVILACLGVIVTVLGSVLVFKGGREDRIDRKRAGEIERLDGDIKELRQDIDSVRAGSRLVASVAIRAIRYIEHEGGEPFPVSELERDALERIRPVV